MIGRAVLITGLPEIRVNYYWRAKMKLEYRARMTVNEKAIEMNAFIEGYVSHIAAGIVQSLKGVDYLSKIDIICDGEEIKIAVNGENISLTPFPNDLISSTLKGMLEPLKGVDEIKKLRISVDIKRS